MKFSRLMKDEKGAALPFVTLLLAFILLGFCALVIDAGLMYGERRTMVTAADSAALAGATIMKEALADKSDLAVAKVKAETVAKDLAVANGVEDIGDVQVSWSNSDYDRNTITVTVKNNKSLIFARFLGFDNTDVAAKAVATWGYTERVEGGDILPIFTKDADYQKDTITYLHAGKFLDTSGDTVNGNWGLLDIYGNTSAIYDAFSGDSIEKKMEINAIIDNQTGLNAGNIINAIEERMVKANALADKEDRITFMCGLVPVIDWAHITKQGASLKLPIYKFAVFEIYDVIVAEGNGNGKQSEGSKYALYDTATYKSDGIAIEYPQIDSNGDGVAEDMAKCTIIGKFTGVEIEVHAVVTDGDQVITDSEILVPPYAKLIE